MLSLLSKIMEIRTQATKIKEITITITQTLKEDKIDKTITTKVIQVTNKIKTETVRAIRIIMGTAIGTTSMIMKEDKIIKANISKIITTIIKIIQETIQETSIREGTIALKETNITTAKIKTIIKDNKITIGTTTTETVSKTNSIPTTTNIREKINTKIIDTNNKVKVNTKTHIIIRHKVINKTDIKIKVKIRVKVKVNIKVKVKVKEMILGIMIRRIFKITKEVENLIMDYRIIDFPILIQNLTNTLEGITPLVTIRIDHKFHKISTMMMMILQ